MNSVQKEIGWYFIRDATNQIFLQKSTAMKQITAIIERNSDGGYSVYCTDDIFSGMGDTVEAAKENMKESIRHYVDACRQDGCQYPKWLDMEYEFVFVRH